MAVIAALIVLALGTPAPTPPPAVSAATPAQVAPPTVMPAPAAPPQAVPAIRHQACANLDLNGHWDGQFEDTRSVRADTYPMRMHVAGMQAGQMRGTLNWPHSQDVYTEMVGTASGCQVLFTETRVIRGPGRVVVLNGRYQGTYDPASGTIAGTWKEPRGLREGGHFQIRKVSL